VVALTERTAQAVTSAFRVRPERLTTVPNAVDPHRWPRASDDDRAAARQRLGVPSAPTHIVAYVGALVEEKGVDDLVAAIPRDAWLLLAGAGSHRAALEAAVAHRGVQAVFLGAVEDPWDVYAAADVLALPSRTESQPAVLLEAGMVGTPCVATRVGDIGTVVCDGETGVLVSPGDPAALALALARLLDDPKRRTSMGAAGRAHVRTSLTLDRVAPQWLEVLETVSAGR
jgi:glycosyltransferase involved in cell wall biosynthesis